MSCTVVGWGAAITSDAGGGGHPREGWLSHVTHPEGELRGVGSNSRIDLGCLSMPSFGG